MSCLQRCVTQRPAVVWWWLLGWIAVLGSVCLLEDMVSNQASPIVVEWIVMLVTSVIYNQTIISSILSWFWCCGGRGGRTRSTNDDDPLMHEEEILHGLATPLLQESSSLEEGETRPAADAVVQEQGGGGEDENDDQDVEGLEEGDTVSVDGAENETSGVVQEGETSAIIPVSDRSHSRAHYLDNLRIFLVAIVVSGHCFGYCSLFFWFDKSRSSWEWFWIPYEVTAQCQAFVMPLFFAISGYVTPISYRRGKGGFLRARRDRLWIPAIVHSFTLAAAELMVIRWYFNGVITYLPNVSQCWYIYTLLICQWMYTKFRQPTWAVLQEEEEEEQGTSRTNENPKPFPSIWKRIGCGLGIGAVGKLIVFLVVHEHDGMNMDDWPTHFTLYWAGVHAYENNWLVGNDNSHHNLTDKVNMTAIRVGVVVQMIVAAISLMRDSVVFNLSLLCVQGIASIEMSIVVVHLFQVYANKPWSRFWASSSYAVYLIHQVIIVCIATAMFHVFRHHEHDFQFTFHPWERWVAFAVVVFGTHALSWSFGWVLANKVPGIRQVLAG